LKESEDIGCFSLPERPCLWNLVFKADAVRRRHTAGKQHPKSLCIVAVSQGLHVFLAICLSAPV